VLRAHRRREQSGEAAEHPARRPADLRPPGAAARALPAGDGVGHQDPLARVDPLAGDLVPERAWVGRQDPVAMPDHLRVRAARGARFDPDEHLVPRRDRLLHLVHPQVARAVQPGRPHGRTTAFRVRPSR
jgi:hypothetical protein